MKTDDLIEVLVKDLVPWRFRSAVAAAVAGGVIIAAVLFFAEVGPRPDISGVVNSGRFLFKFVVTISLAVTAIWVTLSIGRPGGNLSQRLARRTRGKGLAQIVEEMSVYLTE